MRWHSPNGPVSYVYQLYLHMSYMDGIWYISPQPKDGDLIVGAWTSMGTLPETNMAPENRWFEYSFPLGMAYFQVLC